MVKRLGKKFDPFPVLMTLPAILSMVALIAYPLGYTFFMSLFKVDRFSPGAAKLFIGLQNYIDIFKDRYVLTAFTNTIFFAVAMVAIQFVLGLLVALMLYELVRGQQALRAVLLCPFMIAPIVASLQWRWLYVDQYGIINYVLEHFLHLPAPLWLADPVVAKWAVIIVEVWRLYPFTMLVLSARLTAIPREYIEAAEIDGASYLQRLRFILLPLIRSSVLVVVLMQGMDAFRIFDTIYALTEGGPGVSTESLSTYTYLMAFTSHNFEKAGAMSILVTVLLMIFSVGLIKLFDTKEF